MRLWCQTKQLRNGLTHCAPYCSYGYILLRVGGGDRGREQEHNNNKKTGQTHTVAMDMFRWDSGGMSLWEWEHNNKTAQKKKFLRKKTPKISFKENATKESDNQKKKFCPNLKICRQFSFYFGERDMYCTRALGIFYQSEVTSLQVNTFQGNYRVIQTKKLWLPAQ